MSSSALMDGSSSTGSDSPIEFSLTNGQLFQRVMENPSRFNLNPTDRLLLEEGRTSMINRTRYGFLLGATLSPLPLFRGQYAISNLRNLPPLIDRVTQKPNPMVIRARLFWIAQSVVLTTIGSGLGTWLGFKLGLRSMENSLSSLPGSRQRVMEAFNQARQELESEPLDHQSHISPVSRTTKTSHKPTSINNENHDRSFQEQEEDLLKPSSSPTLSNTSHQHSNPAHSKQEPTRSSRWEELRRSPQPHPSTWQTIREQNSPKQPPNSSPPSNRTSSSSSSSSSSSVIGNRAPTTLESPNSNLSQSQDEFERLLERERNLSAGIVHPSDRYSSSKT
ncbi:hypothetical protein PSTG_06586 [Puccinia striiformis f. sp. tritici PST-78]|uniref:Uncharacterized protein n=1 Tax=Puccinia striiformis f. sp. tritici PST-78 TaxID=1165861 RepID=A0A0L0VLP2_9BASI|nr:hypothetical protein PSTG_06586 [Puccinia striiformis f. sp. tritici PST-78]